MRVLLMLLAYFNAAPVSASGESEAIKGFKPLITQGTTAVDPDCDAGLPRKPVKPAKNAQAKPKPIQASDFCTDPYTYTCKPHYASLKTRKENREKLLKIAEAAARADVTEKYKTAPWELIKNPADLPKLLQATAYYADRLNHHLIREFKILDKNIVSKYGENIRLLFNRAVARKVVKGEITKDEGETLHQKVSSVEIVLASDVMALAGNDPLAAHIVLGTFHRFCGKDGLSSNAYANWLPNGKTYVLLCPGWVASTSEAEGVANLAFSNILGVLAHELGHPIDANVYPDIYKSYIKCLKDHHELALPAHLGELTSDYWLAQTAVEYLTINEEALLIEDRLQVVQTLLEGICAQPAGEHHPSMRFRVELLRRDPEIHRLLGCTTPDPKKNPKPGCTLKGPTGKPKF